MSYYVSNVQLGGSVGENTASGAEFCTDRAPGQWQRHPNGAIVDSATRDARRNPNTLLEPGLVLVRSTSTGRWSHYTNGGGAATDQMSILDCLVNILDVNGVAQHTTHPVPVFIRGLVDPAKVFDTAGTAVDSNGRTRLSTGTNGCNVMWQA